MSSGYHVVRTYGTELVGVSVVAGLLFYQLGRDRSTPSTKLFHRILDGVEELAKLTVEALPVVTGTAGAVAGTVADSVNP